MRSAQLFRNENFIRLLRLFWDSSRSQKLGRNVLDKQKQDAPAVDPYEGNYGFLECDRQMKVTVIGAAGRVGKTLSLLLKTCPLIDHLCLFDIDKSVKGVGVDISHIDTKCCVSYVCGMRNVQQALNAPDVVIITAGCPASPHLSGKKLFEKNAPIVAGLSEACARFCPKACVVLITNPINSLLPVMGEVYQVITNQIPLKKMFGLTTLDVVRANTFVAEVIRRDPNNVIVPVIGGTSQETIVPVISQMKPRCKIKRGEMIALTECLKRAEDNLADCQNCGTRGSSTLSTAYAGFRFTSSLLSALKGADDIIECAFVRSNVIPELEYLASPLKLGAQGIEHNFGYPPLSDYELAGLEQSAAVLQSDIKMGKAFVASIEDTIQKGLIWKRLSPDHAKPFEELNSEGKDASKKIQGGEKTEPERLSRKFPVEEERRKEQKRKEQELEVKPTSLTQEVYSEGVRNWAVQSPLKKFFKEQGNCEEVVRDSVPNDLDSDPCKEDPSLHEANPLEELLGRKSLDLETPSRKLGAQRELSTPFISGLLFQNPYKNALSVRGFHTIPVEESDERRLQMKNNKYERYIMENRQRSLVSMKGLKNSMAPVPLNAVHKIQSNLKRKKDVPKTKTNLFKSLNVSARQKYRSFNMQKKFLPSAPVLFLVDKEKKAGKNLGMVVCAFDRKDEEEREEDRRDVIKEVETNSENDQSQLVVANQKDDMSRYKDLILEQLRQLKKENDELKKQMSSLSQDKILETALQVQSHSLELERTKLKAGWLIMTSTMDAFTNFCKRLITKTDAQVAKERKEPTDEQEENDVYVDAVENLEVSDKQKNPDYDEKYFKFLEKLMEGQMESQMENELRQNRIIK